MSTSKKNVSSRIVYANRRLDKVTRLLDDIAEHTGFEYVVISGRFIGLVLELGKTLAKGVLETKEIIEARRALADKYKETNK